MKWVFEILSRDTLITVIKEGYRKYKNFKSLGQEEIAATYRMDLISLSYEFLKKNLVWAEEYDMFCDILSEQDIQTLYEINSYNYYKLKLKIT